MSRPLRIEYPGAWYHIMNRGRRTENVFLDKQDYEGFLELVKNSSEMWNVRIAAYCLMSNHYHMLIQTPDAFLSRFMRHVNGVCEFNVGLSRLIRHILFSPLNIKDICK